MALGRVISLRLDFWSIYNMQMRSLAAKSAVQPSISNLVTNSKGAVANQINQNAQELIQIQKMLTSLYQDTASFLEKTRQSYIRMDLGIAQGFRIDKFVCVVK